MAAAPPSSSQDNPARTLDGDGAPPVRAPPSLPSTAGAGLSLPSTSGRAASSLRHLLSSENKVSSGEIAHGMILQLYFLLLDNDAYVTISQQMAQFEFF
jgi:hypothetical protein